MGFVTLAMNACGQRHIFSQGMVTAPISGIGRGSAKSVGFPIGVPQVMGL